MSNIVNLYQLFGFNVLSNNNFINSSLNHKLFVIWVAGRGRKLGEMLNVRVVEQRNWI